MSMYLPGSILRHYPATPMPKVGEEEDKEEDKGYQSYYEYYERGYHRKKKKPVADHYAAVVIEQGILQVKPKKQLFASVEAWCNAMHDRPADLTKLVDHGKALKEATRKFNNVKYSKLNAEHRLRDAKWKIESLNKSLNRLKEEMEYHKGFL